MSGDTAICPPLLTGSAWAGAGAGESCTGFSVENIHLVLIQTLGAAELESLLTRSKVKVFFSVTDMLAPVTYLWHRGERLWGVIEVIDLAENRKTEKNAIPGETSVTSIMLRFQTVF